MGHANNTKKRRNRRMRHKGGEGTSGEETMPVQPASNETSYIPESVNNAVSGVGNTVSGAATELYNGASNAASSVSNSVSNLTSSSNGSSNGSFLSKFVSGWSWPKRDPTCNNWFTPCATPSIPTSGGKSRKFRNKTQRNLYKKTPKMNIMNGLIKVFTCGKHSRKRSNKKQNGGTPLYLHSFADPQGKELPPYTPHSVLLKGGAVVPYLKSELVDDRQANFDPNGDSYLIGGKRRNRRYKRSSRLH